MSKQDVNEKKVCMLPSEAEAQRKLCLKKLHARTHPPQSFSDDEILRGCVPSSHFTMRLQRYLARAGVASRRGAEKLIQQGRVRVNGKVADVLGTKVEPRCDVIEVDGDVVVLGDDSSYLILNKPPHMLTTMKDPFGHPCVADIPEIKAIPGIFPVGRLDADTTGLLLFTTDGTIANRLLHPSHHVWKSYVCLIEGRLSKANIRALEEGICLEDGPCAPARVREMSPSCAGAYIAPSLHIMKSFEPRSKYSIVELQIHEGRNHQVKRMLAQVSHPVLRLHRLHFGPLVLPTDLALGEVRALSDTQVRQLKAMCEDHS